MGFQLRSKTGTSSPIFHANGFMEKGDCVGLARACFWAGEAFSYDFGKGPKDICVEYNARGIFEIAENFGRNAKRNAIFVEMSHVGDLTIPGTGDFIQFPAEQLNSGCDVNVSGGNESIYLWKLLTFYEFIDGVIFPMVRIRFRA